MEKEEIPLEDFLVPAVRIWDRQWLILACGDFEKKDYNLMTVGWGSFGVMWGRPMALVVVRPTRYTFQFMERFADFTLSAFPETRRKALSYCGSHSGRDGDKAKACGLTPVKSRAVASPGFSESELSLECRKLYSDDLDPARFIDPSIEGNYPAKDYHRMYFGEILSASATPAWRRKE
jgi:flavin reductase (DIM6/NTAB) family NADH-FMN oxidoreductase RutF